MDEEGGTVVRIAGNEAFPVENVGNMSEVGASSDRNAAYETGAYIGGYLVQYGFNVDFAPDADVWVNPYNEVVRYRAFSSDPYMAADMVSGAVEGFHSAGICTALKHFPCHGATAEDSHAGFAYSPRTLRKIERMRVSSFSGGNRCGK